LPGFSVAQDPRSRYFDSFDPDHPPMPPDDPASHELMVCVDGKKGWPHWLRNGERIDLENPIWQEELCGYVEVDEQGKIVLSPDSALRLAYMHSPDFQDQLETIYLSALDVSAERFRLDTQFFGGVDTVFAHAGDLIPARLVYNETLGRFVIRPSIRGAEQNRLTVGRGVTPSPTLELRKRFATAGEIVVGFANSFVWEFTSGNSNLTTSIANLSLVQPLLRGAGRDVALEQLTIVERGLLANLRAFQRYREGFYTNVTIGESGVAGPQRRGGFFGGTGLTGFTGTGSGGLGGVGEATGFGRAGFGAGGTAGAGGGTGFAGGGAGQVGGFIGLLQRLQEIRNTEDALNLQLRTLSLLEAYLDAGVIDLTQVDQFRQSIETERANLLQARNALVDTLESYKTGTLGLPPDLPIELDDQLIQQFQFVDPRATKLQSRVADVRGEVGRLPGDPAVEKLREVLDHAAQLRDQVKEHLAKIQEDLDLMEEKADSRAQAMEEAERNLFRKERERQAAMLAELNGRFSELADRFEALQSRLAEPTRRQTINDLVIWLGDVYKFVQELVLVQARARLESVVVGPIELAPENAFCTALVNRLDIMNNRAALVDTWRLIAFNADALQSNLDVVFEGDISTARNNPVSFRAPTGNLRAGLQFDAPFTRLLERNNYRQSLIDYQRDRRQFIQFLDGVYRSLRSRLRRLEELRVNLEIQRRAVAIAIRRVDVTQEELNRPVPPAEPGQPAAQFGPTAALNLLTALSDLRNAQNNFMSVWLNYYATRMQLMRDLGIMQLDGEGRWIDIPLPAADSSQLEEVELPPAVPHKWLEEAFRESAPTEVPSPPRHLEPPEPGTADELLPSPAQLDATAPQP
jgi:hypothetical protein